MTYIPDYVKLSTNPDVLSSGGQRINDNFDAIASESNGSSWSYRGSWCTRTFINSTAYRYYRLLVSESCPAGAYVWVCELKLIEAGTTTVTPSFTKIAVQYEM